MTDATVSDKNATGTLTVLVYSNDALTRAKVTEGLGRRPSLHVGPFEYVEVATAPVVLQKLEGGGIDLVILDGEAAPVGGLGLAKQLKDEFFPCPPVVVLVGRKDDAWLARWSRAEAIVAHPVDPFELADTIIGLVRNNH
ncbi:response regulator transcription factor [Hoyosella rhizosphaerae]|uniref:Response regulator n=1 Tax=Hoyosella rhizosphaerae TaxID=1755582 RepID=A0A916U6B9_9ACTN|nr:response regulator transcription factor [Hoyosella rhizosphaerae]MBN4926227.1 response regulator transcription factor [Hoyosella rhizosphaerae]GGC61070.1 response regulator [Hoyosella rhizosphaerae]